MMDMVQSLVQKSSRPRSMAWSWRFFSVICVISVMFPAIATFLGLSKRHAKCHAKCHSTSVRTSSFPERSL